MKLLVKIKILVLKIIWLIKRIEDQKILSLRIKQKLSAKINKIRAKNVSHIPPKK